jgi:hypothetical protein
MVSAPDGNPVTPPRRTPEPERSSFSVAVAHGMAKAQMKRYFLAASAMFLSSPYDTLALTQLTSIMPGIFECGIRIVAPLLAIDFFAKFNQRRIHPRRFRRHCFYSLSMLEILILIGYPEN